MGPTVVFHVLVGLALLCVAQAATDPPVITEEDVQLRPFTCPDGGCSSDIFCSSSLSATGLTPTAFQAVESMCALQGPGYFSDSAADFFMAARFRNKTALFSTEPNTPWMLADYALSLSLQQDKLDSGKRIDGFAQVDLLLCNNASCSIVADLQHIRPFGNDTAVLAMGFSGVAGYEGGAGVGMGSVDNQHLEPPNLVPASSNGSFGSGGSGHVMEVQWQLPSANLDASYRSAGPALVGLQDFAQESDIPGMWEWLEVGHYRATVLFSVSHDALPYAGCVTLLWPKIPWMIEHGWDHSDRACEEQYWARLVDPDKPLPPVYVFDSYVNAAHVFLNPRAAAAVKPSSVSSVELLPGFEYNISIFTGSAAELASPPVTSFAFHTNGIELCPNCATCDVLSIGTAAIAARSVQVMSAGAYDNAIHSLRSIEFPPWCFTDPLLEGQIPLIMMGIDNMNTAILVQANALDKTEVQRQAAQGGILFNCSLLGSLGLGYANRTWDAAGRIVPSCSGDACVNASSPSTLVGSQLWYPLLSDRGLYPMRAAGSTTVAAVDQGVRLVVQQAANVLQQRASQELATTDATRRWPGALLDLSVTIVAIVAMASGLGDIQGWLHGKLVWVPGRWAQPCFLWTWVCKPLTALIVLLGLLMPPVFLVISDSNSHTLNANGTSSTVGWLAADTRAPSQGDYSSDEAGSYMVVAAVAIRLKSVRDEVAFGLEILNACVAGIASLCILFSLVWRVPFAEHQALPTKDPADQQAASTAIPRGSDDDMAVTVALPSPSMTPSPLPE